MKWGIILCLGVFFISGCAHKKPRNKETYSILKCQTICKNNQCNQKCVGVEGSK